MSITAPQSSRQGRQLQKSLKSWRSFTNFALTGFAAGCTVIALIPLVSVLWTLISRGISGLSLSDLFTAQIHGGFGQAIVGTLYMVFIAIVLSVPVGILAGVYLSELGRNTKASHFIRFSVKVLTGVPSILAGVFAYAWVVLTMGTFSAFAGGVALAILMLPTVVLTAEEALKQVPRKIREAAFGMGATQTQVITEVVLPTAASGLLTGIFLAVARAAGETAPLLFTTLLSYYWPSGSPLEPVASLSVHVYENAEKDQDLAWRSALVLVALVLAFNLLARFLTRPGKDQR